MFPPSFPTPRLYLLGVLLWYGEDERDGARVDAGGVPRGRQVGAASFSVAFGSVCARVARGLAQVRKADGWFFTS